MKGKFKLIVMVTGYVLMAAGLVLLGFLGGEVFYFRKLVLINGENMVRMSPIYGTWAGVLPIIVGALLVLGSALVSFINRKEKKKGSTQVA
jgi:hypothetical protein